MRGDGDKGTINIYMDGDKGTINIYMDGDKGTINIYTTHLSSSVTGPFMTQQ